MEDKRNILKEEQPFSWKKIKDNKALIYWNQKVIKTIKGHQYDKLIKLQDDYAIQLYIAKITGNFKHGNEK